MTTEKRPRRRYAEDFKREAVALVKEQGYKVFKATRCLKRRGVWILGITCCAVGSGNSRKKRLAAGSAARNVRG